MKSKKTPFNTASTSAHSASGQMVQPQQIKQLLRSRGASMTAVARVCDVTPQTVRAVVFRETKSRRIAMVIADFLDRSLEELFPGMYPDRYRRNADAMLRMKAALARIDTQNATAEV